MGSATRPRGRLPQRVYWVRRSVVLGVALLLVFGIGKMLGGLGSDSAGSARTAATTTAPQSSAATPQSSATAAATAPLGAVTTSRKGLRNQAPLAVPSGPCQASDVSVVPTVPNAPGGGDIPIILQLVGKEPACNFDVSAKTLVVKVTKNDNTFWASWQCTASIPRTQVVVRSAVPATVPVTWNGRASDDSCSNRTAWADPGTYHVYSAAMGSAPQDLEFQVTKPQPAVRTKTVKPKPQRQSASASPSQSASPAPGKSSGKASSSASPKG